MFVTAYFLIQCVKYKSECRRDVSSLLTLSADDCQTRSLIKAHNSQLPSMGSSPDASQNNCVCTAVQRHFICDFFGHKALHSIGVNDH
jgi:hypothetical protein